MLGDVIWLVCVIAFVALTFGLVVTIMRVGLHDREIEWPAQREAEATRHGATT